MSTHLDKKVTQKVVEALLESSTKRRSNKTGGGKASLIEDDPDYIMAQVKLHP